MNKVFFVLVIVLSFGCGSNKTASNEPSNLQTELNRRNRAAIPLLVQIRQKPGIIFKNGVPALQKANNSLSASAQEPLYVLNNQIIGSSFESIDNLIDGFMVKKIEVISGSDASFYGSRGANGVIKITTFSGEDTAQE
ncbi:MAG: hypothetical protein ACFB0A_05870 [Croceivirga sp.]